MTTLQPREPITILGEEIPAGTAEVYTYKLPEDALITGMRIRCYSGQAHALKYRVQVVKTQEERTNNLVRDISGNAEISGNDETFNFDIQRLVERDDLIRVTVANTCSASYTYTTSLKIGIDYNEKIWEDLLFKLTGVI